MRTHGHRDGSITQWGLLWGPGEGQRGMGRLERVTWGEMPDIGDGGLEATNHIEIPSHASENGDH